MTKTITKNYLLRSIKKSIQIIVSFFIVLSFVNGYSQVRNILFEHLSTDDGLSAPIVRCIIQDKIGYLWFGTYSGLDRYDGVSLKSYKNIPGDTLSITNGFVQCLLEDKIGNLWIGTTQGLDKFDRAAETFKHYTLHNEADVNQWNNNIFSICEDRFGYLWIGTGDGLNKFDPTTEKFTHYYNDRSNKNSLTNNVVNSILEDKKGVLWIGTGNGLDKYDRDTDTFTHLWRGTVSTQGYYDGGVTNKYRINIIYEDMEGILWLGTQDGLLELNNDRNKFTLYQSNSKNSQSISFYAITSIQEENNNSLWVGTWNGLNLFDKVTKKFTRFYHDNKVLTSLSHNSISYVLKERSGTLWISTYGGGVNKVDRTTYPFKQYPEQIWREFKRFSSASIMFLNTARDGSIWLATPTGLLNFDPEKEIFHNSKITKNIRLVQEDYKGNLWIGINNSSGRGLIKLEKSGQIINITDSSGNKFPWLVNQIVQQNDSTLWACSGDQGSLIKINARTNKYSIVYKSSATINTIHLDKYGTIWMGTRENGLLSYNPSINKITDHYIFNPRNSKSISGNSIISILEDDKCLWIGTNMGLNKFVRDEKTFTHYSELDGLPHNWVYLIFTDSKKNLWLGTHKGMSKFNPATESFNNYDVLRGLIAADKAGVGCQTKNGEIYLDSPNGLTRFHPDSIRDNPYVPPIVITSVLVADKPMPLTDNLELPYSSDHLYFEFAALSYVRPEKNSYSYKLENLDKEWIRSGNRNKATYTNLKPGEYIFRVRGSNNDGVWNEKDASIKITILPPWWGSGWAFTGYGIIALFIIYLIRVYDLKRQREKHQLELEHDHAKKLEEIDSMKSRFFENISHEFRTPLTLILGPAEQILTNNSDDVVKKNADLIKRNANSLLNLINQLLDLARLDTGRIKLKAAQQNIIPYLKGIVMSFESLALMNSIKLNLYFPANELMVYFDREKMETIIKNLLSNAFKFTPSQNEISVSISTFNESSVEIKVRDTGIGIPEEQLPKIFNRFYQFHSAHTPEHKGTGIGLALVKELVQLHHGSISADSKLGEWTEFRIILPLGKEHLAPYEIVEIDEPTLTENLIFNKSEFVHSTNHNANNENTITSKNIILIVEDNSDVREFIKDSLGNEFHFEEAENGEEGIKQAVEIIPDLIISDIMMPRMNGNEMTRKLKSDQRTSHIPIILLTAKSGQENIIKGLETGADEYIVKPFDPKELHIRINNLINLRKKLQEIYGTEKITTIRKSKHKLKEIDIQFLERILKVIDQHISEEDFTIENFGHEVGMSRSQMFRKIKALTGKSCSVYLRSVRLAKAKIMLQNQEANISEIAYSVGFGSPSYFAHCFKEEYGYAPSEIVK